MNIKYLICDIDGTLMPPSSGNFVSQHVCDALLQLQKEGIRLILASARVIQGVLPLAKQLHMDIYGGYLLSSNGAHIYDAKNDQVIFTHSIAKKDALRFWQIGRTLQLDVGIAQPHHMIASGFSEGFFLDHQSCDVDYLITLHPQAHLQAPITKCTVSQSKEILDTTFAMLQQQIEQQTDCCIVRSTDTVIDVTRKNWGKAEGLHALANICDFSFAYSAAIGDGESDAVMIQKSAFGGTLENGCACCKQYADMITDSYDEEGCLQFFAELRKLREA